MTWIDEFSALDTERRREKQINRIARYIYPTPVWAGGMKDLPSTSDDLWSKGRPRTARGYAIVIADMSE